MPTALRATAWALSALLALASPLPATPNDQPPQLPVLTATGDPQAHTAELWAQVPGEGVWLLELADSPDYREPVQRWTLTARAAQGHTLQVQATGLLASRTYHWRIRPQDGSLPPVESQFRTAPQPDAQGPLTAVLGADLGGQGYGRLREGHASGRSGWPVMAAMARERADLFLALGDMIYSDRAVGPHAPEPDGRGRQWPKPGPGYARDLGDFRSEWRYHRGDPQFQQLLSRTPLVAIWDDHEIVNDSGGPELVRGPSASDLERDPRLLQSDPARPKTAQGGRASVFHHPSLYRDARQAFFEWNPIPRLEGPVEDVAPEGRRLWRSLRWGSQVEIFILDLRTHRDPRWQTDDPERPKTMLGPTQKAWFKQAIARSTATWKWVISSAPLAMGTGNERDPQGRVYRDSWSALEPHNPYGWRHELREWLLHLRDASIRNVVVFSADQHHSAFLSYDLDGDGSPDLHEVNVGPLRAGPGRGRIDSTWKPRLLWTDSGRAEHGYAWVEVEAETGRLQVEFRDVDGQSRPGARLLLQPAAPDPAIRNRP